MKHIYFFLTINFLLGIISCAPPYLSELKDNAEYMRLVKTLNKEPAFYNFPTIDAWKLFFDAPFFEKGPLLIDVEEIGYLEGLSKALAFAIEKKNSPLSVELIEEIHTLATNDVKRKKKDGTYLSGASRFGSKMGGIGINFPLVIGDNASEKGIKYFKEQVENSWFREIEILNGKLSYIRSSITRADILPEAQEIIDQYESSPKNRYDITKFIQALFQLHPFLDGNTRSIVRVLLLKEFLRNNFSPIILFRAKRFAAYTLDEVFSLEIIGGEIRFKNLTTQL